MYRGHSLFSYQYILIAAKHDISDDDEPDESEIQSSEKRVTDQLIPTSNNHETPSPSTTVPGPGLTSRYILLVQDFQYPSLSRNSKTKVPKVIKVTTVFGFNPL